MNIEHFKKIEKTSADLRSGAVKPTIGLLFRRDVTEEDLFCGAAQIMIELEDREEQAAKVQRYTPPAPAVGEVTTIPSRRKK